MITFKNQHRTAVSWGEHLVHRQIIMGPGPPLSILSVLLCPYGLLGSIYCQEDSGSPGSRPGADFTWKSCPGFLQHMKDRGGSINGNAAADAGRQCGFESRLLYCKRKKGPQVRKEKNCCRYIQIAESLCRLM